MKVYASTSGPTVEYARRAVAFLVSAALASTVLVGCHDQLATEPLEEVSTAPAAPVSNKVITVTSASPDEAEQGATLEVRIYGDGFLAGDTPVWERKGVEDTMIHVGEVIFVGATELRAMISIAPDASLGFRDIAVYRQKKGIGSEARGVGEELFQVKQYTPESLGFAQGMWSGTRSFATGINDHGVVVGQSDNMVGWSSAVYWTDEEGAVAFGGDRGYAAAINTNGWIVGVARRNDGSSLDPFIRENGVITILQALEWPHETRPSAINDAGTVVGQGSRNLWSDPTWPIVWKRDANGRYGRPVELPLPGDEAWELDEHWEGSGAFSINARGDVVGTLLTGKWDIITRAVLWRVQADGSYAKPLVLGGGPEGDAAGINDEGWIVGTIGGWYKPMRAVLWHPARYWDPITLSGAAGTETAAYAINNKRQIVGYQRPRWPQPDVAIIWNLDDNGQLIASKLLAPPVGYSGSNAGAINEAGWIVGTSHSPSSAGRVATLWRPDR